MDELTILGVKPLTNHTGEQFYPKTTTDAVFQSDSETGHATETTLTQILYAKADKASEAISGNFAGLDANGNLTDSGKKASDFATVIAVNNIEQLTSEQVEGLEVGDVVSAREFDTTTQEYENYTVESKSQTTCILVLHLRTKNVEAIYSKSNNTWSFVYRRIMSFEDLADMDLSNLSAEGEEKFDAKADKVSEATNGNFAGLDSSGNLTDSGKKASDFATAGDLADFADYVDRTKQNVLTFDSAPTSNSTNPVTSGGVFDALNGKQDVLDFDTTPTENSVNPVVSDGIYRALEGKEDSLTFDTTPTWRSVNPVTSDGIYLALQGKADKIPVAYSAPQGGMLPNVFYMLGTISVDTVLSLAPARDNTVVNVWAWSFETDSIVPSITWPSQITLWSDGFPSVIKPNNYYEVRVMNGLARIIKASPLDASNSYNSDFNNDF